MKIHNSQLNCDIDKYPSTTPFLTKPNIHSQGRTKYNTYNDMNEGTTSKNIIDNEKIKVSLVSVNKFDETIDTSPKKNILNTSIIEDKESNISINNVDDYMVKNFFKT